MWRQGVLVSVHHRDQVLFAVLDGEKQQNPDESILAKPLSAPRATGVQCHQRCGDRQRFDLNVGVGIKRHPAKRGVVHGRCKPRHYPDIRIPEMA